MFAVNNHRNFGIIIALTVFFTFTYLLASELVTSNKSKGEILLFQRGHQRDLRSDVESPPKVGRVSNGRNAPSQKVSTSIQKQTSVFHWKDICFDIKIKKEVRRILNHVDGWVKPGTLTALMVSCSCICSLNFLSGLRFLRFATGERGGKKKCKERILATFLTFLLGPLGCRKDITFRCSCYS